MNVTIISLRSRQDSGSKRISELLSQAAKDVFGNCGIISIPMADGGEGTVDAVIAAVNL